MPTEILRPTAGGNLSQHTPVGEAAGWQCVDESVSDDDATYVEVTATAGNFGIATNLYMMSDMAGAGAITSVRVNTRIRYASAGDSHQTTATFRISGTNYGGTADTMIDAAYVESVEAFAIGPDGLAWTLARVNAMQCGHASLIDNSSGAGAASQRITQFWVEVDSVDAFVPGSTPNITIASQQPSFVMDNIFIPLTSPGITISGGVIGPAFIMADFDDHECFVYDAKGKRPINRSVRSR